MRSAFWVVLTLCFLSGAHVIRSQDKPNPPTQPVVDPVWLWPFDMYENIPHNDEKARLENFANELKQQPEATGYIIVYAGRRSCAGEARRHAAWAKNFLVKECGIQPERLIWMDGGYKEIAVLEMWLRPKDMPAPDLMPSLSASDAQSIRGCGRKQNSPHKTKRAQPRKSQSTFTVHFQPETGEYGK